MPLKRIIPCLDVDAGRVVKGTHFVDLCDAGYPVELARATMRKAPTNSSSWILPRRTRTRHDPGPGSSHRRRRLRPAHGRRRHPLHGGLRRRSSTLARTKSPSTPRRWPGSELICELAVGSAPNASWSRSTPSPSADGELIPLSRVRLRRPRRSGPRGPGLGERGDRTRGGGGAPDEHGPRRHQRGYDLPLTRAVADSVAVPVIASGGVGELEAPLVEGAH